MRTIEELKAEFGSTPNERKMKQKIDFARLGDADFFTLISLGHNEIDMFITPQAAKYIQERKTGTLIDRTADFDDQDQGQEPEREITPERAARILGTTIGNPRAR